MKTKRADKLQFTDIGRDIKATVGKDSLEGVLRVFYPVTTDDRRLCDDPDTETLTGVIVHTDYGTLTLNPHSWVHFPEY